MKVAIIYGWAEGHLHGKRLRAALHRSGFEIANTPQEADIIISHSGGCYLVPPESKARLILLIGLPLWTGKDAVTSTKEKLKTEPKGLWWLQKSLFNVYYLITRPSGTFIMKKAVEDQTLPKLAQANLLLVRNEKDPYMHPAETQTLANEKGWSYVSMNSHHDDLWVRPEPYVELIKARVSEPRPSS